MGIATVVRVFLCANTNGITFASKKNEKVLGAAKRAAKKDCLTITKRRKEFIMLTFMLVTACVVAFAVLASVGMNIGMKLYK